MADALSLIESSSRVEITSPTLEVIEGHITTTSNQIAAHFGKRHDTVLRAIRNLECSAEYRRRNFAETFNEVPGPNGAIRKATAYRITRDGFVFLAMGFTGKEAAQWKEAYITAFNKMEAELQNRNTRPANPAIDYARISPAQAQDLKELVHAIAAAKVQTFGETWARLHKKFRVNSYLDLPAAQFEEASAYLLGKLTDQPKDAINPMDGPALRAARNVALSYFTSYQDAMKAGRPAPRPNEIPREVLEGLLAEAILRQRVLITFAPGTGRMESQLIPSDASIISLETADYTGLVRDIPMERLPELAEALNKRVARHLGALSANRQVELPGIRTA